MAKRRVEIALQDEINDQDSWNAFLEKDGLTVVDVYQDWCGPCSAVLGLFKRLKTEINDDLLHFATAKADNIEALHLYRGKCEPYFLIYGGGCLVAAVKGVNPPLLEKCIFDKLKQEHDVLNGEARRVEIRDPMVLAKELEETELRTKREGEEEVKQEVTLAVLKPDIVAAGLAEQIIEELKEKGVEVLEQQEHLFTTEEAEIFYENSKDQPYFQDLVEFMTSGPSRILVCALEGNQGVIDELRGLIGPSILEDDSGEYSETLRAKYASGKIRNAIHAADSKEEAAKELAFFYPGYEPPVITVKRDRLLHETSTEQIDAGKKGRIQRTVAILRPQAYELYKDKILEEIKKAGFTIAMQKVIRLTKEQVEDYYKEHIGQPYFGELTVVMSSGPCLALLLAREDAVSKWKEMLGPTKIDDAKATAPESLRARFVPKQLTDNFNVKSGEINLLHGSANESEVERDLNFFFPVETTVAAIKPDAYANRDEIIERIKSAGFHVAARQETSLTKELAEKLYEDCADKPFYNDLINHMTSGQTLFMILTRRNAIAGWRQMMGPTDPNKAADESSDNIRAIYGRDILRNAVHGASNEEHVKRIQELLFDNLGTSEKSHTLSEGMKTDKARKTDEEDVTRKGEIDEINDEEQEAEWAKLRDNELKENEEEKQPEEEENNCSDKMLPKDMNLLPSCVQKPNCYINLLEEKSPNPPGVTEIDNASISPVIQDIQQATRDNNDVLPGQNILTEIIAEAVSTEENVDASPEDNLSLKTRSSVQD
ncbi:unnamed protein product [Heterobilharzia americana]|nr:unnamed protein product [Heterobilharzia americana]